MTANPSLREALSELANASRALFNADAESYRSEMRAALDAALAKADSALVVAPMDRARANVLAVEIPRDELALVIGCGVLAVSPPPGTNATWALDEFNKAPIPDPAVPPVGQGFRNAADKAVAYFHECLNRAAAMQ